MLQFFFSFPLSFFFSVFQECLTHRILFLYDVSPTGKWAPLPVHFYFIFIFSKVRPPFFLPHFVGCDTRKEKRKKLWITKRLKTRTFQLICFIWLCICFILLLSWFIPSTRCRQKFPLHLPFCPNSFQNPHNFSYLVNQKIKGIHTHTQKYWKTSVRPQPLESPATLDLNNFLHN